MKNKSFGILAVLMSISLLAHAQAPGGGPGPGSGLNFAMAKLFGDVKGFTAKAEMHMADKSGAEMMSMTMDYVFSAGKTRMDLDMASMKSAMMPPQAAAMMKQMGMDKVGTVILPEKKVAIMIYPGLQAYMESPLPADEAKAAQSDFKIEVKEVGKETIDGHACIKNQVTMSDDAGKKYEATTWNAEDMKKFPIQMEMGEKGMTITTKYKDIKFAKPDDKIFDMPAGFKKCANQQELMVIAQQKMTGGK